MKKYKYRIVSEQINKWESPRYFIQVKRRKIFRSQWLNIEFQDLPDNPEGWGYKLKDGRFAFTSEEYAKFFFETPKDSWGNVGEVKKSNKELPSFFEKGFNCPFDSPMGVVHEVLDIKASGYCGCASMKEIKDGTFNYEMEPLYTLVVEVEDLDINDKNDDELFDFTKSPSKYLKENPHAQTKIKIETVYMTETELKKYAL